MAPVEVALDGVSVVVKGLFNAAIFSPAWMLAQGLIGTTEYGDAEVELVTREFASFTTGWLNCQVTPDAMQLATVVPEEFERVRDAVLGILNTLPHTPVAALGINRQVHFPTSDLNHYNAIGDSLVPKGFWEPLVALPATRHISVWGQRSDNYGGRVQISVEPSLRFLRHVFVSHNDHFNLLTVDKQPTTREEAFENDLQSTGGEPSPHKIGIVKEILTSEWKSSMSRSIEVVNKIARIQ